MREIEREAESCCCLVTSALACPKLGHGLNIEVGFMHSCRPSQPCNILVSIRTCSGELSSHTHHHNTHLSHPLLPLGIELESAGNV